MGSVLEFRRIDNVIPDRPERILIPGKKSRYRPEVGHRWMTERHSIHPNPDRRSVRRDKIRLRRQSPAEIRIPISRGDPTLRRRVDRPERFDRIAVIANDCFFA